MPRSALREVKVDYKIRSTEMPNVLVELTKELNHLKTKSMVKQDERTRLEIDVAAEGENLEKKIMDHGEYSEFTCPECSGVLTLYRDGTIKRYRCHTGHGYSVESLLAALAISIEENLYSTMRAMEESVFLLDQTGDRLAELNDPQHAAQYFNKAGETKDKINLIRKALTDQNRPE